MADFSGTALGGVRVIDLTSVLSGPGATQILGDMGADVVKVEPPFGDETRRMGQPAYHDGSAASYSNVNRNKRCISIDLARPEGREILLKLLEDADVLMENFKPGTLRKWGLGFEEVLSRRFPQLIYCQLTAFGGYGPLGGLPGYDPVAQGYSGIMSLNGYEGGDPLRVNIPAVDWAAAHYAAIGILGALVERQRSGVGQAIEITLHEAAISLLHPFASNWLLKGVLPKRMGNRHPAAAPYDIFPTRDGHVVFMVNNTRQFQGLCDALDLPELRDDERFQTTMGRVANVELLAGVLKPIFAASNRDGIVDRLTRGGVPVAPVLDVAEALTHPHAVARGDVVEGRNGYRGTASPLRFGRTPVQYRTVPPMQGEHSREVLREAGFGEDAIEAMIADGIVIEAGGGAGRRTA